MGCSGCLGLIILIPSLLLTAFYLEENLSGARAWESTKAELAAQGESIDPADYVPATVPDEQNFAALPFFRETEVPNNFDPFGIGHKTVKKLEGMESIKDLLGKLPSSASDAKPDTLPYLGRWVHGDKIDVADVRKKIGAFLEHQLPEKNFSALDDTVHLFQLIFPLLAELRTANTARPFCRFNRDYGPPRPWEGTFSSTTDLIRVTQLLTYEERLALLNKNPELALQDMSVTWKISSGIYREPLIVSQIVANGLTRIQLQIVNQGLAEHAWNDQQLTALDDELCKFDILASSQFCVRGELARYSIPLFDYYSSHRSKWLKDSLILNSMFTLEESDHIWKDRALEATYLLIPSGWFERFKSMHARKALRFNQTVDVAKRRVYPGTEPEADEDPDADWRSRSIDSITMKSPFGGHYITKTFVYTQVQVDEARIACRLERYRLAHGSYPATLALLVPAYGELPHDIMTGEPYHYALKPDQTYLLYSEGWNQTDDHGTEPHRTKESPDWVWANFPDQFPTK